MSMDNVLLNDIAAHYVTGTAHADIVFDLTKPYGSVHAGKALMKTGPGTYNLVSTGSEIAGKLIKVEPDGKISVQDGGYMDLPGDGTTITYTAANNAVIGGATAGTIKSALAEEAVGAVRRATAEQPATESGRVMVLISN